MQRRGPTVRILTIRLNLEIIVWFLVGFAAGFAITQWAPWDTSPADPATIPHEQIEETARSKAVLASLVGGTASPLTAVGSSSP